MRDPEKIKAAQRKYHLTHAEKRRAAAAAWKKANAERCAAYQAAYDLEHKERKKKYRMGRREKHKIYWAEYSKKNREKINAKQRADRAADPDKTKDATLKLRYGISLAERLAMIERQGGKCASCQDPLNLQVKAAVHTDHIHGTKIVRGILCRGCNTAVGILKENSSRIRLLADYVDRFSHLSAVGGAAGEP